MLVLALVWWAWSAFVWATNAHDPDDPLVRGVLFAAIILTFVVALAIPGAFGDEATVFVVAYAGVRFLHLGLYADASRRGNASLAAIAGFGVTVATRSATARAWRCAAALRSTSPVTRASACSWSAR
jgi:low temperature requirement protein LtrA